MVIVIGISCCFQNGCVPRRGISGVYGLQPALESPMTTPVFCVYKNTDGDELDYIRRIKVSLDTRYSELPPGQIEGVIDWFIDYKPESSAHKGRPVTTIKYATVPPGYKETHPALPLIPEKVYVAYVWGLSYHFPSYGIRFVIRSDDSGTPVKLEYVDSPIKIGR